VGTLCEPSGDAVPRASSGGSDQPATAAFSAAPREAAAVQDDAAGAAALVAPAVPASGTAPYEPPLPLQAPAPAGSAGLGSCGGLSAGQGSSKGASAPVVAALLGTSYESLLAVEDAAPTAPAAGSPTLSATDPATRPD
jgi:hypothetical protein